MHVDVAQLETHRAALTGHCYRMLGSAFDADDAVQETMVRAWRSLDRFDGRASLRTWMYRIATNVCLDALSSRSRRARPMEERPDGTVDEELETRPRTHWLEPIPDVRALPSDADPLELYVQAFHRYDVDELVSLLREDATLSMPPYTLWLRGPETIRAWLLGRGCGCRGSRLVPTAACGLPAFGQYRPGGSHGTHHP